MQRIHHLVLATVLFFPSSTLAAEYEITVLATNIANFGGFGEWSFSALYEGDDESILFDTGWDENTVLHNAEILRKDLSKVEKVVLSHWHFDHTGGLLALRDRYRTINEKAFSQVYVANGFFTQRYMHSQHWPNGRKIIGTSGETSDATALAPIGPGNYAFSADFRKAAEKAGIKFIEVDAVTKIAPDIYITGPVRKESESRMVPAHIFIKRNDAFEVDPIHDDQSIGYMTGSGWLVMSGCGHAGLINTSEVLLEVDNKPIYSAMGGFHLFKASSNRVDKTGTWLKEKGLGLFMGGHCTGITAAERIANIVGLDQERLSLAAVGSVVTKELEFIRSSAE